MPETPIVDKALKIATRIYQADGINISQRAHRQLKQIESWGMVIWRFVWLNPSIVFLMTRRYLGHQAALKCQ